MYSGKEAIEDFADKGYINGTSEKEFSPNAEIKREEFVKIIVNVFDLAMKRRNVIFGLRQKHVVLQYVASSKLA